MIADIANAKIAEMITVQLSGRGAQVRAWVRGCVAIMCSDCLILSSGIITIIYVNHEVVILPPPATKEYRC